MPKAYAVVTYRSVSDPEKLAAYAKLAGACLHDINDQLRKAPHQGNDQLGTSCHLAKRRPAVSKPKIFLQRVGEAEQRVFLKWAAHDLEAYRQPGICPAAGDRKGR